MKTLEAAARRNPEDSRTTYAYNNADQVTTVANMNKTATGFLTKFDYKYDPAGNRLAVKENSGDRVTWTYDTTNQLLSERRSGTHAYRNTFIYDSRGNRLVNNQGGTRTTTTYDAANQIRYSQAAAGRTSYTFDANGNQQRVLDPSGNRTTTTWDFENQPTVYELPAGTRVTMAYNADNQRVKNDASGGTTKFLWDRQNYLAEANGTNTIQTVYTNEPQQFGNLISTRLGTTTVWHQFDALGSTAGLSNSSGTQTGDAWIYDAWGNVVSRAGTTAVLLQWIGELGYYCDADISSHYVRRRAYISLARWTAVDPHQFGDGLNRYAYAHNAPIHTRDPSGLDAQLTWDGGHAAFIFEALDICGEGDWITIKVEFYGPGISWANPWDAFVGAPGEIGVTARPGRLNKEAQYVIATIKGCDECAARMVPFMNSAMSSDFCDAVTQSLSNPKTALVTAKGKGDFSTYSIIEHCLTFRRAARLAYCGTKPFQPPTKSRFPCFRAGTRILTSRGPTPIERIAPGDTVTTLYDGRACVDTAVLKAIVHAVDAYCLLEIEFDSRDKLVVTLDHPLFDGEGWVYPRQLSVGDFLWSCTKNAYIRIVHVNRIESVCALFNIETGSNAFVIHPFGIIASGAASADSSNRHENSVATAWL